MEYKVFFEYGIVGAVLFMVLAVVIWSMRYLITRLDQARTDSLLKEVRSISENIGAKAVAQGIEAREKLCGSEHAELAKEMKLLTQTMAELTGMLNFIIDHYIPRKIDHYIPRKEDTDGHSK